jgi:hypothetical protein
MTTRTVCSARFLAVLCGWIFCALTLFGCAARADAPAKSPAEAGATLDMEESEAAPEAPAPNAPSEMPAPVAAEAAPPPGLFDEGKVAQGGPPRASAPKAEEAVRDAPAPAPTPGIPPGADSASVPGREPLLIYTATMTLAVYGARDAIGAVEELARKSGGYLVSRGDETVTIRVPTKAFLGALSGVSKLGDELHREVNVRDVTEQFADLEIRLKNAEAVRQRLEALLAKAAKIEDALAVERELERVTQTIEQMKGRLRLLSELIAFSTITVNFRARPHDQVGSEVHLPFGWLGELGLVPLMNLEAQ